MTMAVRDATAIPLRDLADRFDPDLACHMAGPWAATERLALEPLEGRPGRRLIGLRCEALPGRATCPSGCG